MRDVAQTVAHDAYAGDGRALLILVGVLLVGLACLAFIEWLKGKNR